MSDGSSADIRRAGLCKFLGAVVVVAGHNAQGLKCLAKTHIVAEDAVEVIFV